VPAREIEGPSQTVTQARSDRQERQLSFRVVAVIASTRTGSAPGMQRYLDFWRATRQSLVDLAQGSRPEPMKLMLNAGTTTFSGNHIRGSTLLAAFATIFSVGAILPSSADAGCCRSGETGYHWYRTGPLAPSRLPARLLLVPLISLRFRRHLDFCLFRRVPLQLSARARCWRPGSSSSAKCVSTWPSRLLGSKAGAGSAVTKSVQGGCAQR
jgi:hypothetical protein